MPNYRPCIAAAALVGWALGGPSSSGQSAAPSGPPPQRAEEVAANSRSGGTINLRNLATTAAPRAAPRLDGRAMAGLKLTLDGSASSGGQVWYRWIQTQGPRVVLANIDRPETSFVVPNDATALGFVLVVGNAAGVDARALAIDVLETERSEAEAELRADAGGNQTTGVGRRVMLDGKASEPSGRIRYRWMQVGGPAAKIQSTAGSTCSFIPDVAGEYQFALLVIGATGLVSDPAVVTVRAVAAVRSDRDGTPADNPDMAIDELARRSLGSIPGGASHAADLAGVFDALAERAESTRTYRETTAEMTRRLDAIMPRDRDRRDHWLASFVRPVTAKLATRMKASGLDPSQPDGPEKPLNKGQRAELAGQLRFAAAGLRASNRLR